MTTLVARLPDIQQRLDALARRHRVPGAVLGIGLGDEVLDFATGVVNVSTGVETTTDSIFQIGSNTKLLTATLVMQLVDEGKVDLDAPVRTYVPSFELAEPGAAAAITVRHLLTHTSGIQGDYFEAFGRGDEAVERYVASLRDLDLVHPVGEQWSYCNSGFVLAGHLVEKVTGTPFRTALAERLCKPLGLRQTTVVVDEMLASRCAVGHVPGTDGKPVVPPVFMMEYASVPAGSMTTSTAADLIRFVQMHLARGTASNGTRILSAESATAMQQVQLERPPTSTAPLGQGLGWVTEDWDGKRVIGHGGGTIGQLSFLQAIPEAELVITLLTNSATGGGLWRDLGRWLFEELAGVRMAGAPKAPEIAPAVDLDAYAGTYERLGVRYRVEVDGDALLLHSEMTGALAELQQGPPPPPVRLTPIDRERFAARVQGGDACAVFHHFDRGRPGYLFLGRTARRLRARSAARPTATAVPKKKVAAKKTAASKRTRAKR